jgi:hypothetical protein
MCESRDMSPPPAARPGRARRPPAAAFTLRLHPALCPTPVQGSASSAVTRRRRRGAGRTRRSPAVMRVP